MTSISKYMYIDKLDGIINMFTAKSFSETRTFMYLSKHVFRGQ